MRRFITFGASPRATINLTEGARALAMLRGRSYALPEDMTDLVPDVLRHRVVLSYEGAVRRPHARQPGRRRSWPRFPLRPNRSNMKSWWLST
jgi:MoxR-like ATPase